MDFQLSILQFFQGVKNPILDTLFLVLTMSTELPVIIAFTAYMYWCLNKKSGQKILFSLVGNITLNTGIKEFFKAPRPIGIKGIESMRVETATGYSFPSGHTQMATTFWTSIIQIFKRKWITILGTIIVLGVGISRLYLGVHWPIDVIVGWIVGFLFTILLCKLFDYVDKTKKYNILLLTLVPFIIGVFVVNSGEYTKIFGLLTGFIIGYIIEDKYIKFKTEYKINIYKQNKNSDRNRIKRDISRFLIGIVSLGLLYVGLKFIMPKNYIFDYIRYTLIVLYAMAGVPYIFKVFKLD